MTEKNTYTMLVTREIEVEAADTPSALHELFKALQEINVDFGDFDFAVRIKKIEDGKGNAIDLSDMHTGFFQSANERA